MVSESSRNCVENKLLYPYNNEFHQSPGFLGSPEILKSSVSKLLENSWTHVPGSPPPADNQQGDAGNRRITFSIAELMEHRWGDGDGNRRRGTLSPTRTALLTIREHLERSHEIEKHNLVGVRHHNRSSSAPADSFGALLPNSKAVLLTVCKTRPLTRCWQVESSCPRQPQQQQLEEFFSGGTRIGSDNFAVFVTPQRRVSFESAQRLQQPPRLVRKKRRTWKKHKIRLAREAVRLQGKEKTTSDKPVTHHADHGSCAATFGKMQPDVGARGSASSGEQKSYRGRTIRKPRPPPIICPSPSNVAFGKLPGTATREGNAEGNKINNSNNHPVSTVFSEASSAQVCFVKMCTFKPCRRYCLETCRRVLGCVVRKGMCV